MPVLLERDTYGVPHVYGATEADVAFGFGYAQAHDHLYFMLRNYLEAAGRLSEIDGASAVETDVRTRLWRTAERAEAAYPRLDPATRAYLDAFVAGINRYMDEHPGDTPPWADRVTPAAVIALYRLLHIRLNEWTMPELASTASGGLSNQWAIAPEKTAGGATICAMDPHVPWVPVFRMYEAHLAGDDGLEVYGAASFGLPTILLGHTGRHAWSLTINRCDVSDMYVERLDPKHPRRYRYEDGWRTMEEEEIVLRVRTDDGYREERRTLAWTHHGPVVGVDGCTAYTLRMSAYDIVDPITPFLDLARARSLDAFKAALASLDVPMFNFVYGDAEGRLYYVYHQRCPARSEGYDWRRPVPGWTRETEWDGYLRFERLPQIENPEAGFLQNCNNAPWYVTPDSGLRPEDYPPYAVFEEMNGRGRRVRDRLQRHDAITPEQTIALVMDEHNVTADEFKPQLLRAYAAHRDGMHDPDGRLARAIALLGAWDNAGAVDSVGMTLFALWKIHYDESLGVRPGDADPEQQDDVMLDALRRTTDYMRVHYGRLEVRWGEVHLLRRGDREFPVGGSSYGTESIRPVRGRLDDDGRMIADYGSAFTMVVELSDPVRAWSLVPFGGSERPDSPHYDDQAELWTYKRLKRTWFTREEVEAHRESRKEISPCS